MSSAMCPAPMAFHDECYERASVMWQPEADSYCEVDPLFPETAQWVELQHAEEARQRETRS